MDSRPVEQPNVGNPRIPENILLYSQGFQPQPQNMFPRTYNTEVQFLPPEQFQFQGNPCNVNCPYGFLPAQLIMQPYDYLNAMTCFPQPVFPGGQFPSRQFPPIMMPNIVTPGGHPSNYIPPWTGQFPWMDTNRFVNNFTQEMNMPWLNRFAMNRGKNVVPEVVTLEDEIKIEFVNPTVPTVNARRFEDFLKENNVCSKHLRKAKEVHKVATETMALEQSTSTEKIVSVTNDSDQAEAVIETCKEASYALPAPNHETTTEKPETSRKTILIKSSSAKAKTIQPTKEMTSSIAPVFKPQEDQVNVPETNSGPPLSNLPTSSLPVKKRKVSFWDREHIPLKPEGAKILKDSELKKKKPNVKKLIKESSQGKAPRMQLSSKSYADATLISNCCVLIKDMISKDVQGDAPSDSDDGSKFSPSLTHSSCLTDETSNNI